MFFLAMQKQNLKIELALANEHSKFFKTPLESMSGILKSF